MAVNGNIRESGKKEKWGAMKCDENGKENFTDETESIIA